MSETREVEATGADSRGESEGPSGARAGLEDRFVAFITDRHPFALPAAHEAFRTVCPTAAVEPGASSRLIDGVSNPLCETIERLLRKRIAAPDGETSPRVSGKKRLGRAIEELLTDCAGFMRREAIAASLTRPEKLELLRGMVLTRATDNRLKAFFAGAEVKHRGISFQGKGFRSLGQEAIYAATLRLRRGKEHRDGDGRWKGDVVAPLIRDCGAALGMRPEADVVHLILSAQMGKAGPPMDGRDFHIGAFEWGILPASTPLSIPSLTIAGLALAFARDGGERVAVSLIGEGGSSLGEWHEAINLCAARRLPAIFCVQNNQIALSTPVTQQSAVRAFADKAAGYGVPGLTIDGTDPEAIAAAFAWAAERARAGEGPSLIELVAMRMCGHAHHDDMLYLGRDPKPSRGYPELQSGGYADPEPFEYWAKRDPIAEYADRLRSEGIIAADELDEIWSEAEALVEVEAQRVIAAPWPEADTVTQRVFAEPGPTIVSSPPANLPPLRPDAPFDSKGSTMLEAITLGVRDAMRGDSRVFVYGEDVGGTYGNAFLLLRPLLEEFGDRIVNAPLAEGAVLGACIGAALGGLRPIGEMQFNDFVATGFNQLVNNAAKTHYRWGAPVPIVIRMPWGGLRGAGPYHSQNTEAWFYRTPGLKIVAPSTPVDARALLAAAVADPDPVLFYEHIGLYRDPSIKQHLDDDPPDPLPLGQAALRRSGSDLAIVSYGAYVHVARRSAETLASEGHSVAVLDLRSLVPLDRAALLAVARHCGKVLIVHEDTRTGGIGESLAAIVQENAFEYLDAPVTVCASLDTPVPYSPPLEQAFLPSQADVETAARKLLSY